MKLAIGLALGTFVGNWLLLPFVSSSRTHTDGFCIGLIAAAIIFVSYAFILKK